MQPKFQISANNIDITAFIQRRLVSITITDEPGIKSDSLDIVLDDRHNDIALLPTEAELTIALGKLDKSQQLKMVEQGRFTVDEIELSGAPEQYRISAKAANMTKQLKQQKTRAWDTISLSELVATIAEQHGLKSRVAEQFQTIQLNHISQTEESDLHLLTRLGRQYDAVAKPANGFLLFMPKGSLKSATGQTLTPINIAKEQCSEWSVTIADRSKYQSVIVYWNNTQTGERVAEQAGEGSPSYTVRGTRKTQLEAQQTAKAKLAALQRGQSLGSLTVANGELLTAAEAPLSLTGFREGIAGNWVITRTEHVINNSGLETRLEFETPDK